MFIIKKEILISGKGPMKELDNTALTAEAECFLNFTKLVKKKLFKGSLSRVRQFLLLKTL